MYVFWGRVQKNDSWRVFVIAVVYDCHQMAKKKDVSQHEECVDDWSHDDSECASFDAHTDSGNKRKKILEKKQTKEH